MDHPTAPRMTIGGEFKAVAFHPGENTPFLTRDIPFDDQIFGTKPGTYQLDFKSFCQELRPLLRSKDEIVQITLSFKPRGSKFATLDFLQIQWHIFLYSNSDGICDQYHTGVSSEHILNPTSYGSFRTNKFAPFYVDELNTAYLIVNNHFPDYLCTNPGSYNIDHKLKISLHLHNEVETLVKHVTIPSKAKFNIVNIRELFDLKEKKHYTGLVHIFSGTANFWCYIMIMGKNKDDISLMCEHFGGG